MTLIAVALGGALGALSRYGFSQLIPYAPGKFPVATFSVNVAGSFLIGVFFVLIVEKAALPPVWRSAIMVGFLGAFTTFSTFSMESFQLISSGYWKLALVYILVSAFACVLAAAAGYSVLNKLI